MDLLLVLLFPRTFMRMFMYVIVGSVVGCIISSANQHAHRSYERSPEGIAKRAAEQKAADAQFHLEEQRIAAFNHAGHVDLNGLPIRMNSMGNILVDNRSCDPSITSMCIQRDVLNGQR